MIKVTRIFIENLWLKTRNNKKLTQGERVISFALCFFEVLYRGGFALVNLYKRSKKPYHASIPVISVGNISVGGTGKSVFVRFLMEYLQSGKVAVLLRGYGRLHEHASQSLMISDGSEILCRVKQAGDEAFMLANLFKGPVVVGSSRAKSAQLLESFIRTSHRKLDFIVLDDAYQHHSLYKDLEILLLDARYPFENGHCLPAGRLREKDISRAHGIIFTHADQISTELLEQHKNLVRSLVKPDVFIVAGKHAVSGVFFENSGDDLRELLLEESFLLCAGIGSWTGLLATVQKVGVCIKASQQFQDHHDYTEIDIKNIYKHMINKGLSRILTTEKDWYKIQPLLSKLKLHDTFLWYVLRIEFQFLVSHELDTFTAYMERYKI